MLKEFKEFAFKGNLVDMAVGIIIGGAFATVVKSLVDNVFMPPLGKVMAGVDFSKLKIVLQDGVAEVKNDAGEVVTAAVPEVAVNWGQFVQDFVSFVILALVVFIVIKKIVGSMKKEEIAAPKPPPKEVVLLEEIRDALVKGS
ncbi:MAG: large conductance mechanosensitive channel protein MscL [Akkermansiaceae bacterium]|nr:large conductance mechanosensitive channel protein MscL [Akkermansiaceae bacterium]